jgi:hypothetical protein
MVCRGTHTSVELDRIGHPRDPFENTKASCDLRSRRTLSCVFADGNGQYSRFGSEVLFLRNQNSIHDMDNAVGAFDVCSDDG